MKISRIMHKIMVCEEDLSLKQAAKLMSKKKIGSLIQVKKGEIAGILTERDVLKNIDKLNKKLSEVMSKNVVFIDAEESLEDAAEIMSNNKIKRLPVVEGNKLVGIITATDIIANVEGFEGF